MARYPHDLCFEGDERVGGKCGARGVCSFSVGSCLSLEVFNPPFICAL